MIGYDVSEHLDLEPAKYFVVVTKREKRACKQREEGGVAAAPVPARIIEKGLVSDGMVIHTVVAKYSDHLPPYRQSAILEREAGGSGQLALLTAPRRSSGRIPRACHSRSASIFFGALPAIYVQPKAEG